MTKLKLYHYWRSSSSWRVRWGLALKGIDLKDPSQVELISVNLLTDEAESAEHRARNPLGYVPVLELPGRTYLGESLAILGWLEEIIPSPSLFPMNPIHRARTRQLAEIINAGTQPLANPNVLEVHSANPEERKQWVRRWIRQGLHAYESLVSETAGRFSVGDTVTVADLCLIPQCYNALRSEIPLSEFPRIEQIYRQARETAECRAADPEAFAPPNTPA